MSLYALLKSFAAACIDRTEADIHAASTALHEYFEGKVEAPVEAEVAKVEEVPEAVVTEAKAEIEAATEAVAEEVAK